MDRERDVAETENLPARIEGDMVLLGSMVTHYNQVLAIGHQVAKPLADFIEREELYKYINGKKHVLVDAWTTCGAMLGVVARETEVREILRDDGTVDYWAYVDLVRASDGGVVGGASSIVGSDESEWQKKPRYARRSMAVTRATGKAFRLGYSWIMRLAGYEPTVAEEMTGLGASGSARVGQTTPRQIAGGSANPEVLACSNKNCGKRVPKARVQYCQHHNLDLCCVDCEKHYAEWDHGVESPGVAEGVVPAETARQECVAKDCGRVLNEMEKAACARENAPRQCADHLAVYNDGCREHLPDEVRATC